jgi:hypothetical protein
MVTWGGAETRLPNNRLQLAAQVDQGGLQSFARSAPPNPHLQPMRAALIRRQRRSGPGN